MRGNEVGLPWNGLRPPGRAKCLSGSIRLNTGMRAGFIRSRIRSPLHLLQLRRQFLRERTAGRNLQHNAARGDDDQPAQRRFRRAQQDQDTPVNAPRQHRHRHALVETSHEEHLCHDKEQIPRLPLNHPFPVNIRHALPFHTRGGLWGRNERGGISIFARIEFVRKIRVFIPQLGGWQPAKHGTRHPSLCPVGHCRGKPRVSPVLRTPAGERSLCRRLSFSLDRARNGEGGGAGVSSVGMKRKFGRCHHYPQACRFCTAGQGASSKMAQSAGNADAAHEDQAQRP